MVYHVGFHKVKFSVEGSIVECDSPESIEMFLQGLHAFNERQREAFEAKKRAEAPKPGRPVTTNIAESKTQRRKELFGDAIKFLLLLRMNGRGGVSTDSVMKAFETDDARSLGGTIAAINSLLIECHLDVSEVYRSLSLDGRKGWYSAIKTELAIATMFRLYREEFGEEHPLNDEEDVGQMDDAEQSSSERISREDAIRNLLKTEGPMTRSQITEKTGFPAGTINANLTTKKFKQTTNGLWTAEKPVTIDDLFEQ